MLCSEHQKRNKDFFEADEYVYFLDCSDSNRNIYIPYIYTHQTIYINYVQVCIPIIPQ